MVSTETRYIVQKRKLVREYLIRRVGNTEKAMQRQLLHLQLQLATQIGSTITVREVLACFLLRQRFLTVLHLKIDQIALKKFRMSNLKNRRHLMILLIESKYILQLDHSLRSSIE